MKKDIHEKSTERKTFSGSANIKSFFFFFLNILLVPITWNQRRESKQALTISF